MCYNERKLAAPRGEENRDNLNSGTNPGRVTKLHSDSPTVGGSGVVQMRRSDRLSGQVTSSTSQDRPSQMLAQLPRGTWLV